MTDGLVSYSGDFALENSADGACQDSLKIYVKKGRKKSRKIYITVVTNGLI